MHGCSVIGRPLCPSTALHAIASPQLLKWARRWSGGNYRKAAACSLPASRSCMCWRQLLEVRGRLHTCACTPPSLSLACSPLAMFGGCCNATASLCHYLSNPVDAACLLPACPHNRHTLRGLPRVSPNPPGSLPGVPLGVVLLVHMPRSAPPPRASTGVLPSQQWDAAAASTP